MFSIYTIKLYGIKQFIFSERKWVSSEKESVICLQSIKVKGEEGVKCEGGKVCNKWNIWYPIKSRIYKLITLISTANLIMINMCKPKTRGLESWEDFQLLDCEESGYR